MSVHMQTFFRRSETDPVDAADPSDSGASRIDRTLEFGRADLGRSAPERADFESDRQFDRAIGGLLAMNHRVMALIEGAERDLVRAAQHPHGVEVDMNPYNRARVARGRRAGFRPMR